MTNNNLLIVGAGGFGRVARETAEAMSIFEKIDFLDDYADGAVGKLADNRRFINNYQFAFVALGNSELRLKWINILQNNCFKIVSLIHPRATVSPSAMIHSGVIVEANAVLNASVELCTGAIISIGSLIDHDALIGEGAHIDTGAIVKPRCIVDPGVKVDAGQVFNEEKDTIPLKHGIR